MSYSKDQLAGSQEYEPTHVVDCAGSMDGSRSGYEDDGAKTGNWGSGLGIFAYGGTAVVVSVGGFVYFGSQDMRYPMIMIWRVRMPDSSCPLITSSIGTVTIPIMSFLNEV